jgi:hypothetical protein
MTIKLIIAFLTFYGLGYFTCMLRRWMEEEMPTNREIKRRMKARRPRV